MQAITQFQMHPSELKMMLEEVLSQAAGTKPGGLYITPQDLPTLSAADAAQVLGFKSTVTLDALVMRWPEHIKPIIEPGKAKRYHTEEILRAKQMNLKSKRM